MKHVGDAYGRVRSSLRECLTPLGMLCEAGPLAGGFLSHLQRQEPELCEQLFQEVLYVDKEVVLPVYRLARALHTLTTRCGPATLAVNA